jgi:EmrB/QacA subfamily drug resistance transporter
VLVVLSLAQFMVILDVTVVNVALPVIADQLQLDRAALTWVVTAYTLCLGGLMLLGGRMADVLGRRRVFLTGLVVFTLASLGSGLAADASALIASRAAQGVGAALLSPAALSIVTTTFHGPSRNRALGVWAAIGGAGAAIGVLLGGLLTAGPGWEWIFYINVPVGAFVAVATLFIIPGAKSRPARGRLDLPGAALITAAVALVIYGLVRAGDDGWSALGTLLPLVAGLLLVTAFVARERSVAQPLVRLDILTRRPVAAGLTLMAFATALLLSYFFLSSQYLQHVLRLDSLQTGLVFLPVAIAIGLGTHLGLRVIGRFGARPAAAAGFGLAAVGAAVLARMPAEGSAVVDLLPGFAVAGLGLGAVFVAATTTALAHVDPERAGTVSALVNTGHEIGASLGIALASTLAAASLAGVPGEPVVVTGFRTAFIVAAAASAILAAVSLRLVPAGRPELGHGPVMAH